MDAGTIGLIKEIEVSFGWHLNGTHLESIKELFDQVEKINVSHFGMYWNSVNSLLKYCSNVKHLALAGTDANGYNGFKDPSNGWIVDNDWLNHHFPTLEYISFDSIPKEEIAQYATFFRLNPNIKKFGLTLECHKEIGSHLIAAGIQFDLLHTFHGWIEDEHLDLLKTLHDGKLYKRLHLSGDISTIDHDEKLISIEVEELNVINLYSKIPLLPNLIELNIGSCSGSYKLYKNVKNSVERFNSGVFDAEHIEKIIANFPKLKHLWIEEVYSDDINLIAWNKAREKLTGACKTTVYVDEHTFWNTKWATSTTNLSHIELKRTQACPWEDKSRSFYAPDMVENAQN